MSRKNKRRKRITKRPLITDSSESGLGYAPRRGIDIPSQSVSISDTLDTFQVDRIYHHNSIGKNIVDLPAEDMTRNGWKLSMDDAELAADITDRLKELNVKSALTQLFKYQRLYGTGAIFIGVDENNTPDQEINVNKLKKLLFLTPFSRKKIGNLDYSDDVTNEHYGKISRISVDGTDIDHTRFLLANGEKFETERYGRSIFEYIEDELEASKTGITSISKLLGDFSFKVYKSPDIDSMDAEDKLLLGTVANQQFETDALAMIGENESLDNVGKAVTGIKELTDYTWERIAAAARMPKSIIMGQESGTLTGAQYDLMNYYSRIKTLQENELRPHLEYIVRLLLWASDEPGGSIDPDSMDWSIEFNDLFQLDESTATDIGYKKAQTDQIYLKTGVATQDEIRETRFGNFGGTDTDNLNTDSADEASVSWFSRLRGHR